MEIYAVNIAKELDVDLYSEFLLYIDEDKSRKINRLKNYDDRKRTLIGDLLIRWIVCDKFKIPNEEIKYEYNRYGKPKLENVADFHFSISHSGDWVVAAIDCSPIGIDIERVCNLDYLEIAEHFFNENEYTWLKSRNKKFRLEAFYILWTLKESYIKASGKGLSIPLNSFNTVIDEAGQIHVIDLKQESENKYFKTIKLENGYVMSVCLKDRPTHSIVKRLNIIELQNHL